MGSITYQALSSQTYPEFIYYEGKCYHLLEDKYRSRSGVILDESVIEDYITCQSCVDDNPRNTLYVTYDES
jgi:hypothetical protein